MPSSAWAVQGCGRCRSVGVGGVGAGSGAVGVAAAGGVSWSGRRAQLTLPLEAP